MVCVVEVQVGEGAGGDEQDVLGVDHHEVVFVPVLGHVQRDEDLAALQQLEQRLLHAFAADVARPAPVRAPGLRRAILSISSMNTMPALRQLDVLVGPVEQLADHHLDVLAVVAGLGVFGGVGDGEGNVEAARPGSGRCASCPSRSARSAARSTS